MITDKGLIQLGFTSLTDFILNNDGDGVYIKKWLSDKPQPTEVEIETAHTAWENDYARNRLKEYPSIEECVHAMLDDGLVALQEKRAAVKAKYPKEVS